MTAVLILCLLPSQRWCGGVRTPVGVPLVVQAPVAVPVPPGGCCSVRCTCGCNEGRPCVCGNGPTAEPDAVERGQGGPLFGREGPTTDGEEPAYYRNGRRVTRSEAITAVEQGPADSRIPGDAKLPSLSLMGGAKEARRALRAALEADPKLRLAVKWQDYEAGDPMIERHKVDGLTVYVQAADGTVLHREAALTPDAAAALPDRIKEALGLKPKTPPPEPKTPPAPLGPDGKPAPRPLLRPVTWVALAGLLLLLIIIASTTHPAPRQES